MKPTSNSLNCFFGIPLAVLTFFTLSCGEANEGVENPSPPQNQAKLSADTSTIEVVENCIPENTPGYLGSIISSQIGIFKVESEIPFLEEQVGYETKEVDQIIPSVDGIEKTRKVNHIYYNMTEVLTLKMTIDNPRLIASINTYDNRFVTPACIAVGSSFEDLLKSYSIRDIQFNYEDRFAYVQCNELGGVQFAFPESIIADMTVVDQQEGAVSIDNIIIEGNVIAISVKV